MSSDDATNPGLEEDELAPPVLDPIEDAWLAQEPETVEQMARARLAEDANDAKSHSWLGLALCVTNKMPAGQASLKRAFELLRAELEKTADEDQRHELNWELHGISNRLVDALGENPALGVAAAQFIVDGLKFEHAPSLRLISEHVATQQGDPIKAAGFLKRALAVDSTDPESHYLASRLFARLGKKPQVLSHLQKALDNAAGTIAVRTLARFEPDFDGFRKDPEFAELVDPFPKDEVLRPIYQALDTGDFTAVVELATANAPKVPNRLDVLYPWREALELLMDQAPGDELDQNLNAQLDVVQTEIETREDNDEESPVYSKFCGDA